MKKNGFTLIELLAVIVILAIIALIATPIILGIINDAREESNERSVELYASAVRNAIAAYQLTNLNAPTKFSDLDVQYDGEVECTTQELYEDGSFYITGCTVNGTAVNYTYGEKQVTKGTIGICNPIDVQEEGSYTAGDKYECDVDPNKEGYDYTFYVLTTVEVSEGEERPTSVNLIMDSNITISGNSVKEELNLSDSKYVAWTSWEYLEENVTQEELSGWVNLGRFGPVTAMEYLQNATKDWENVNSQTVSTFTRCEDVGVACTDEKMAVTYTTNARLPYLSEVEATGCDKYACPEWMVTYSENGYWLLSSESHSIAWSVWGDSVSLDGTDGFVWIDYKGVRPVINLSI